MRSFIPWIGGKTLLAKKIIAEFPNDFGRYIEVFGGGASILFAKEKHAKIEVYNDANSELVNLFRCIKYHREELQKEITGYINSREIFYELREHMKCSGFTDIQRAAMFFVMIKISYGADGRTYGCGNKYADTSLFANVEKRLQRVNIEHKDFEELIKQYDRPDALFYCDPPYHTTEKHYAEKFSVDDHYRLNTALKGLKGRFILSYNDDDFIRSLYQNYTIIPVERNNNLSSGTFKELIIKNF